MVNKKVIVISDSFKGSLSSAKACNLIKNALNDVLPELDVIAIPIADGGEGTVDTYQILFGGQRESVQVLGPEGHSVEGFYAILPDGTAVMEIASVAGLTQMKNGLNVCDATSFGLGQLMTHALDKGIRKFIIGLGGSATNDGGTGAAVAIGVKFMNKDGQTFLPVGGTLNDIYDINFDYVHPGIKQSEISLMCDVDNKLLGPEGASAVFGPQKGADKQTVELLDDGLRNFASVLKKCKNVNICDIQGGGAAGGVGAGFYGLFNAILYRGIDILLEEIEFDRLLDDAFLVISGEGRFDAQSFQGKVVSGIGKRAKAKNVPLLLIVGDVADDNSITIEDYGITSILSINRIAAPFEVLRTRSEKDLFDTVRNVFNLYSELSLSSHSD